MGFNAGDQNLYRYVGNSPTNYTDPEGLQRSNNLLNLDGFLDDLSLVINESGFFGTNMDRRPPPPKNPIEKIEYWKLQQQADKVKQTTEGQWKADWYYDTVLQLPKQDYHWFENADYKEYRRGCIGLCNVRLGLPYMTDPIKSAEAGFFDYDSAEKYAKTLPAKDGKKVRIFAVLFDKLRVLDDKQWKTLQERKVGRVPYFKGIVDMGAEFDYCTLHQEGGMRSTWYWESMRRSYSRGEPDARHRPFDWLFPANVEKKTSFKYVMFCVVYAKQSHILPPAYSYGK
jgi:hypothetical protein